MFRKPRTDNVYALRTLSNKLWKIYYLKLLPEKSFSENVSILYIETSKIKSKFDISILYIY